MSSISMPASPQPRGPDGESESVSGSRALDERYGAVSGHMDGQSHPAINRATALYDVLFGDPFVDRPRRPGRQGRQSFSLRAMEEAIDPRYRTTKGELRARFGGEARPEDAHEVVDLRTRLFYHSPLNDRRPPRMDDLAAGRPLGPHAAGRVERHASRALDKIDAQIAEVERFAAGHPQVVVARTAAEARHLMLQHPDQMVMLTSVEGGTGIVNSQADAEALRKRGVTHLTLIHLADDEHGPAATLPGGGFLARLINPRGVRREHRGEDPGLSDLGRKSLGWLSNSGVVLDLSHMSHQALDEALAWCEANGVSPIVSHGFLEADAHAAPASGPLSHALAHRPRESFHGHRAITEEQLVRLYKLGGHFGIVLSGKAHDPADGTQRAFVREYKRLIDVLHKPENIQEILGLAVPTPYSALTREQRTRLSLAGAAGDFNAMEPAEPSASGPGALPVERFGLSDPGVVPSVLEMVVRDSGGDPNVLEPLLLGSERSLQIAEKAAAKGAAFRIQTTLARKGLGVDAQLLGSLADGLGTRADAMTLRWLSREIEAAERRLTPSEAAQVRDAYLELEDLVNGTLYRAGLYDDIQRSTP